MTSRLCYAYSMIPFVLAALGISLAINIGMFLLAYRWQTDKLTDASYAMTFIVLAGCALLASPVEPFKLVLFGMITFWALRLGGFLLFRIWRTGIDSRFDGVRDNFWKFGKFWLAQAISVWLILLPSLMALWYDETYFTSLSYVGISVWIVGVVIEVLADIQKYRFNQNPNNKDKWIASGIWAYARHPNYFGEMLVWLGIFIYTATVLSTAQVLIGIISPIYSICLLLFVSGVPPLERVADKRWGHQSAYKRYKHRTSLLIPLPPRK